MLQKIFQALRRFFGLEKGQAKKKTKPKSTEDIYPLF
jgi:hypothetical protein